MDGVDFTHTQQNFEEDGTGENSLCVLFLSIKGGSTKKAPVAHAKAFPQALPTVICHGQFNQKR
jgi:hypothetical protein